MQEQAVGVTSLRRSLRPRIANPTKVAFSSGQKAATRKRPREVEVEQATGHRRKRSRKLEQQPPLVQQPKGKKRRQDTLDPIYNNSAAAPRKRARRVLRNTTVDTTSDNEAASQLGKEEPNPIGYWAETHKWPKRFAEQSENNMKHLLARQKSSNSLRRKQSAPASLEPPSVTPSSAAPSSTTPSDQKPREAKSALYQDARYEALLATKGSFMREYELRITEQSRETYLKLLDAKQTIPSGSLFRDDIFQRTCQNLQNRNEARVIQDITRLIVPSAETLTTLGAKHLSILIEGVNEGWNNSMPLEGTRFRPSSLPAFKRPQPDYSVGFKREAFTTVQLDKLSPYIGDFISADESFVMATYYMHFPFLTCEVKCGAAALDIADRQNAYSMTLAVRAIVDLFRLVGREKELDREILAFSISHDHRSVRIYGHYPVIDGKETKFYRHPIHEFSFTALDGKEKWTAYKFTKNVYDIWMPSHFKRICSAIDKIPADLDFSVPPLSQSSGLSQDLERHHLESQESNDATPDTSFTDRSAPKRPRKRPAEG